MNPLNRGPKLIATAVASAAAAAVLGTDEEAMKTANEITMQRILAWHKACTDELVKLGAPEDAASEMAMVIFDVECKPKGSYLGWPNADTTAKLWKERGDVGSVGE